MVFQKYLAAPIAGLLLVFGSQSILAQTLSYAGCADVTKADFLKVPLVTRTDHKIEEPIQMAIAQDGRIFWVERAGLARVWNPADNKATTLLDLSDRILSTASGGLEQGASGIALDPAFATNQWIYVYWAVKEAKAFRVSRYTLSGNTLNAELPIIEIPYTNIGCCHTAGSMTFDFSGNLWVAVGNTTNNGSGYGSKNLDSSTNYVNESDFAGDDQRGSANTNSLLGKILRIKPKPATSGTTIGVGKTYDIPEGNLFPVDQYPADKTRPEIYTMGHRNPYSITVDPYRNWLTWGEIGPDEFGGGDTVLTEEHNLVTKPGFMGWPYFVGKNQRYRLKKDPAKPMNLSKNNTGLTELPPAQPAIHPYGHSAAVTGPIYYYDGRLPSKTKLPPHFNKKWLFSDFNAGYVDVASVDEQGKSLTSTNRFWANAFLSRPLDMEIGPDGNLYVLEYSGWFNAGTDTRIARVEYKGTCQATGLIPTAIKGPSDRALHSAMLGSAWSNLIGSSRLYLPEGVKGVVIFDIRGHKVLESRSLNGQTGWFNLPSELRSSVYRIQYLR